jgi:hypothetical protein
MQILTKVESQPSTKAQTYKLGTNYIFGVIWNGTNIGEVKFILGPSFSGLTDDGTLFAFGKKLIVGDFVYTTLKKREALYEFIHRSEKSFISDDEIFSISDGNFIIEESS